MNLYFDYHLLMLKDLIDHMCLMLAMKKSIENKKTKKFKFIITDLFNEICVKSSPLSVVVLKSLVSLLVLTTGDSTRVCCICDVLEDFLLADIFLSFFLSFLSLRFDPKNPIL